MEMIDPISEKTMRNSYLSLLIATLVSSFGDYIYQVAIVVYLYEITGSRLSSEDISFSSFFRLWSWLRSSAR
jgi:hypothetical protein